MANPDKKSPEGSEKGSRIDTVVAKAEQLRKTMSGKGEKGFRLGDIENMATKQIESDKAKSPFDPKKPLDDDVLKSAGIVGGSDHKSVAESHSATDASSVLATVQSSVANKETVLPGASKDTGIKVDPNYKPNAQSENAAMLSAKMASADEGNVLRSSASAGSAQPNLGSGFRFSEPPQGQESSAPAGQAGQVQQSPQSMQSVNSGSANSGLSNPSLANPSLTNSGSASNASANQPGSQGVGNQAGNENMQLQRYEEEPGRRSGFMSGALAMLGGLIVVGGVGTVAMKPELLQSLTNSSTIKADDNASPRQIAERRAARSAIIPTEEDEGALTAEPDVSRSGDTDLASLTPQAAENTVTRNTQPEVAEKESAILAVLDASGEDGQPIPLSMAVMNVGPSDEAYVRISGMPDNIKLSDGIHLGNAGWLLPVSKLTTLRLSSPEGFSGVLNLRAQLLKADAETPVGKGKSFKVTISKPGQQVAAASAASSSSPVVRAESSSAIDRVPPRATRTRRQLPGLKAAQAGADELGTLPAGGAVQQRRDALRLRAPVRLAESLPVDSRRGPVRVESLIGNNRPTSSRQRRQQIASVAPIPVPTTMSSSQKVRMLKRGDQLYRLGDLVSARSIYQQVAATGDSEAAIAMGRTFDPVYFDKLGVQGVSPQPEVAMEWYKKALTAGLVGQAQDKIDNLQRYMNR